ncbi:MAG: hypothetical protein H6654_15910 [Ardenticatenaceae bacterium]|nr:hypothetical protein [Anaerolineales bacterium]MCB8939533.1 hypothetical protein [Ardenticatenaceae bacterium]MCB8975044.1 hypothetical protein [Ardenticatenaceae bacterium]
MSEPWQGFDRYFQSAVYVCLIEREYIGVLCESERPFTIAKEKKLLWYLDQLL